MHTWIWHKGRNGLFEGRKRSAREGREEIEKKFSDVYNYVQFNEPLPFVC